MDKKVTYSYKIVPIHHFGRLDIVKTDYINILKNLGDNGWELVSTQMDGQNVIGFFKLKIVQ